MLQVTLKTLLLLFVLFSVVSAGKRLPKSLDTSGEEKLSLLLLDKQLSSSEKRALYADPAYAHILQSAIQELEEERDNLRRRRAQKKRLETREPLDQENLKKRLVRAAFKYRG
eukprot:TRINITY_DN3787_c0_g1_i1.p1 TRINITY_DN3787_c0_g1~~TRINITY_DN3787_c0_g1_i1.p1  ORF type:complete len:113 (-),score=28.93 TRINITY_DN3787_c0_g1_i1:192-530(-)